MKNKLAPATIDPFAPTPAPSVDPLPPLTSGKSYIFADAGRSDRYIDIYEDSLRYVPELKAWMKWTGDHWKVLAHGGIIPQLSKSLGEKLLNEANKMANDEQRAYAKREALKFGSSAGLAGMLTFAEADERVRVSVESLDQKPHLFAVSNGVVDLNTGTYRRGERGDLLTKKSNVIFDATAVCPQWEKFLNEVLNPDLDNPELIRFVQKWIGYTLSGFMDERGFMFLHGNGCNGKTTFTNTLSQLCGEYSCVASPGLLMVTNEDEQQAMASIQGSRLLLGQETTEGSKLSEDRIKKVTSKDRTSGRILYVGKIEFFPTSKLWMYGNHRPTIQGNDKGIWSRVNLIGFNEDFSDRSDSNLELKLSKEMSGILNWAIKGFQMWKQEGLKQPKSVSDDTEEYRQSEDTIGQFLKEKIDKDDPSQNTFLTCKEMFDIYTSWAREGGIKHTLTKINLGKKLRERKIQECRTAGERGWKNVSQKN